MSRSNITGYLGLFGIGFVLYKIFTQESVSGSITEKVANLIDDAKNKLDPGAWANSANAQKYVPFIEQVAANLGIPPYLLSRVAYQESHFRDDIVSGAVRSSAGAVGLMQLMPNFFPGAGVNWQNDVGTAGNLLVGLYKQFQDWQLALAAYNWGAGNVNKFLNGTKAMPTETENYVTQVIADVPVIGSVVNV